MDVDGGDGAAGGDDASTSVAFVVNKPLSYAAAVDLVAALYSPEHKAQAPSVESLVALPFDEQLVASVPPLVLAGELQLPPGCPTASSQAWWSRMHDRCLVVGAYLHGLGNHDAIRGDANLVLLSTMQNVVEAQGSTVAATGDEAQATRSAAAREALQSGPEAVFAFAGLLYPPTHQLNR
jgi:hypothetical protein